MIKKYGIAILAIVIAVGSAAFTKRAQTISATHVFEFNPSLAYTEANVSNTANWDYIGEISQKPLCSGMNKACRVAVTDSYVDDPSDPAALSGVTLSTQVASSGDAIVTDITDDNDNGFSNQQ